ncbi:hypothetical protein JYT82_00655 [bacterium AH-315-K20]|nr:hypothetical protein [bacterium AH-315-K20]
MNPKSGKACKTVPPADPVEVFDADNANPGKVAEAKVEQVKQEKGKYGQTKAPEGKKSDEDKPDKKQKEEPKATAKAKWEKEFVLPNHNSSFPPTTPPTDVIPEIAKSRMIVETEHVPDGTPATISVSHVFGDSVKDGTIEELEVKDNKVVSKTTGQPPVWIFESKHKPWEVWDTPYFRFSCSIRYQSLSAETTDDYKARKGECLRVRYWTYCLAPRSGLTGTQTEGAALKGKLDDAGIHSAAVFTGQGASSDTDAYNLFGSAMRNTYCFHIGCHGNVARRADKWLPTAFIHSSVDDPADFKKHGKKGKLPRPTKSWRGHICYGATTRISFVDFASKGRVAYNNHELGDTEIATKADIPSVPRYLLYVSCCLVGWDASFADEVTSRGCQNVIAFRKTIGDNIAVSKATEFFDAWKKTGLDPYKIPPIFFRVYADVYTSMRPVLFGRSGGEISSRGIVNSANAIGSAVTGSVLKFAHSLFK